MEFDWERAIERNFEAIEAILARLYALAGITSLRPFVATLPRFMRIRILAILRPAEFAARRLIAMAACSRAFDFSLQRERSAAPGAPRPAPVAPASPDSASRRIAAFPLFDSIKRCGSPWRLPGDDASDGFAGQAFSPLPPDEPVDARGLCRRIAALRNALDDFDDHALRLARWRARRHRETCRPRRWMPMRPGRPPGWAKRPRTPLEEVLAECHRLGRDAWGIPDTS